MQDKNKDLGDFIRPRGVNEGILINSNNQALESYKKAKERFSKLDKVDLLDKKVDKLTVLVEQLLQRETNGR